MEADRPPGLVPDRSIDELCDALQLARPQLCFLEPGCLPLATLTGRISIPNCAPGIFSAHSFAVVEALHSEGTVEARRSLLLGLRLRGPSVTGRSPSVRTPERWLPVWVG